MLSPACRIAAAVALGLVLHRPAQAEDYTIVSQTKMGDDVRTTTTYLTSDRYRHAAPDRDVIVEFGTGRIVGVDHEKKQYWESTLAELQAQMAQMKKQLSQNPQAAAAMENMMGDSKAEPVLEKVAGTRKIAGYDCEHYTLSMGDSLHSDFWTTTAIHPPAQMFQARQALMAKNPLGTHFEKFAERMGTLKGYPLAESMSLTLMGQQRETSSEATSVKKGPLPKSTFAIPASYTRVESPGQAMGKKASTRR